MQSNGPNPYLKTKIMTASPEELRLMLYDGALRFCRQARAAIERGEIENTHNNLVRAQKIVMELSNSLNHDMAPELCERLSALYNFIYRRLVDANVNRDVAAVDESIQLIEYERETWQMLMHKVKQDGDAAATSVAAAPPAAPAPRAAKLPAGYGALQAGSAAPAGGFSQSA